MTQRLGSRVTITAVIPTKNRPEDLLAAVVSIIDQRRKADQLVIIDQSTSVAGRDAVAAAVTAVGGPVLVHVLDPSIAGLVAAKHASLAHATGDIVCFFEDDVVLEPDYLLEIERGFERYPSMRGCSGVITNPHSTSALYRAAYRLFHRGVFTDPRPDVYARVQSGSAVFEPSNIINGGLSAWRRDVFADVGFDTTNPFHMMEDAEFSARVSRRFADSLFINPMARLRHNPSPVNRASALGTQHRKIFEYVLFYKKNRHDAASRLWFAWLLSGLLLDAMFQAVRRRDTIPLRGYFAGLSAGIRYAIR